ncbi:hypothetical protein QCA50_007896 [Cerrena zonata]|uniref:Uncharacterized protein n=1 Tax=Cerrena zonata TaxID=2478898 RepID=A0AAW0G6Y2_9APHY
MDLCEESPLPDLTSSDNEQKKLDIYPKCSFRKSIVEDVQDDKYHQSSEDQQYEEPPSSEDASDHEKNTHRHTKHRQSGKRARGKDQKAKKRQKAPGIHQYTPNPEEEVHAEADDPEVLKGYPEWDKEVDYEHIFQDLEKVDIVNCPPALPSLYRWKGLSAFDVHPIRHGFDRNKNADTYIYIFDSSDEGYRLAKKLDSVHKGIPQGPLEKMTEIGLQQMKHGNWLMAQDLNGKGDAKDDLVQAYVPQDNSGRSREGKTDSTCTSIQSVRSSERCYSLGITFEKQTLFSASNANSKIKNGGTDKGGEIRTDVLKTTTQVFLEGWEEAPITMRDTIADMTDMLAMPHVGSPKNKWCPSVQLNIAQPRRYNSNQGLDEQEFFGGLHRDLGDIICSISALVSLSDNPKNYEGGRFHLISLGVYVVLDEIDVFYFSGHHLHGGTPPLAPEGEENIEDWAYRCVVIFYPASKIISGSSQVFMAGSGIHGEPVTLPRKVFS